MRRRTESVQEKASEELLLTGQQQWAKTEGNPRTDARICTPPPPPPPTTGRRDEKGAAGGSGAKAAAASRGGSRPAPAKRGRDRHRHWHWRAASCRAVLVLEFLEACAGAAVRARRGGGWQVDRSHQPPSDGRSPPLPLPCRTAPHLLRLQIFTATSTHLYFLSNTAGRSWFSRTRAGVADLGE